METLSDIFGLNVEKLNALQMSARTFVLFFASLVFVRIAGIRTLGKQSSFDILTALMLGAILGRAAVTDQSFFGSLFAALILVLLHRFVAWVTFKSKGIGKYLKGENILLMKNGIKNEKNLSDQHITEEDILEALRQDVNTDSLDHIKEVYLERSGNISLIKKEEFKY